MYTFSQTGGNSKSRIDRFYCSSNIIGRVQRVKYENNKESDHKMVYLRLEKQVEMGSGIWIFNSSLLQDIAYTNQVKEINNYKNANFPDKRSTWEFLKMEIINFSKSFEKYKANKRTVENRTSENKLEILPLFLAMTEVTFPRLPGLLIKVTLILETNNCIDSLSVSHDTSNHLSGLSAYEFNISQSIV